jgi:hypothetical protein
VGEIGEGTIEGRILQQVLGEIDDIARATFGSITMATMLKMLERQRSARGSASKSRPRNDS